MIGSGDETMKMPKVVAAEHAADEAFGLTDEENELCNKAWSITKSDSFNAVLPPKGKHGEDILPGMLVDYPKGYKTVLRVVASLGGVVQVVSMDGDYLDAAECSYVPFRTADGVEVLAGDNVRTEDGKIVAIQKFAMEGTEPVAETAAGRLRGDEVLFKVPRSVEEVAQNLSTLASSISEEAREGRAPVRWQDMWSLADELKASMRSFSREGRKKAAPGAGAPSSDAQEGEAR